LSIVLRDAGWRPTFSGAALVSLLAGAAVVVCMPRTTARPERAAADPGRAIDRVRSAWLAPGTRLGFWLHFSCMSTATVFATLWGVPYLVAAGFSQAAAGALLLVLVLGGMAASLSIGSVTAVRPAWRVPLALVVCVATTSGWGAMLALGGDHPAAPAVVLLVLVMSTGGPASSIGFALARDYNRSAIVGTATGVVNVGGFVATILGTAVMGLVLELIGTGSPGDYRLALASVLVIQLFGTVQVVGCWRRLRAEVLDRQVDGLPVPVPAYRHSWDLATRS
jgi:predicted MFS family arabinose efflux permease